MLYYARVDAAKEMSLERWKRNVFINLEISAIYTFHSQGTPEIELSAQPPAERRKIQLYFFISWKPLQ